jgi:hypothetical protein
MNREFHFYALYFIARRAGLPEEMVRIIATSSQFIDDAIVSYEIDPGPEAYKTVATQNYVFWDPEIASSVYLPYHFLPGDVERSSHERRDGQRNPYITTPDSPIARKVIVEALRTGDPFRIGIALHAYADTWAHQHFTGRLEDTNAMETSSPLPPAGHLQAQKLPDQALGLWRDERLKPQFGHIDNRERFLAAAKMIYRLLRTSRREPFDDEELVLDELGELWRRDARQMEERISDFRILLEIEPYDRRTWMEDAGIVARTDSPADAEDERASGYDKILWLKEELKHRLRGGDGIRPVETGGRFFGSELHRWNEAAKAHRTAVHSLLAEAGLTAGAPGGAR